MQRTTILEGVVGSRAYGLERPDSDTDTAGIFMARTVEFLGLDRVEHTYETKSPDHCGYELGHFCYLALRSNPHMLELLWLGQYTTLTPVGQELVDIRDYFLSAAQVKGAYLGYAKEQFRRMQRQAAINASHLPETKARRAKNAWHMLRLITQGQELYRTGTMTMRVSDPEYYFAFGNAAAEDPMVASSVLAAAEDTFGLTSPLPEEAGRDEVIHWLKAVRVGQLKEEWDALRAPIP